MFSLRLINNLYRFLKKLHIEDSYKYKRRVDVVII